MRTTVTLDEDVAARLNDAVRRTGRSFREVVNEALRAGLDARAKRQEPFRVKTFNTGPLRPGLSLDNIEALLDELEGPWRR